MCRRLFSSGVTYATLAQETRGHDRWEDEAQEQIRMLADEACSHTSVQRAAVFRNLKLSLALLQSRAMPWCSSHAFASWPERRERRSKRGNMQK